MCGRERRRHTGDAPCQLLTIHTRSTQGPVSHSGSDGKNVVRKEIKKQKKQFPYVRALYNTSGHRVQAGIWQLFNSLHLKVTVAWQTCNQAGEDGGLYPSSGAASCNILRARMDLKRKKNNKTKQRLSAQRREHFVGFTAA